MHAETRFNGPLKVIPAGICEAARYGTSPTLPTMNDLLNLAALLIEHGADIDERDPESNHTALSQAIIEGHTEYVDFLLKHGASTQLSDPPETRPLLLAEARGLVEIIRLLRAKSNP